MVSEFYPTVVFYPAMTSFEIILRRFLCLQMYVLGLKIQQQSSSFGLWTHFYRHFLGKDFYTAGREYSNENLYQFLEL